MYDCMSWFSIKMEALNSFLMIFMITFTAYAPYIKYTRWYTALKKLLQVIAKGAHQDFWSANTASIEMQSFH